MKLNYLRNWNKTKIKREKENFIACIVSISQVLYNREVLFKEFWTLNLKLICISVLFVSIERRNAKKNKKRNYKLIKL